MKCPYCKREVKSIRRPFGMENKPGTELCDDCIAYDEEQVERWQR